MKRSLLRHLLLAPLLLAPQTGAAFGLSTPAGDEAPPRIVAIGDVHGAIEPLRGLLRRARLIDGEDHWIGGKAVLVQTGDVMDRGADVRAAIALLRRLQGEAHEAGGQVIALLGNHEGMNLARVYRDVGPEAYSRFVDADSEKRRKRAYDDWRELIKERAERRGMRAHFTAEVRQAWMDEHPLGSLEYRAAIAPQGELGSWLREHRTVVQVGDTIFIHGGLGPELEGRSFEEINQLIADEIAATDATWARLEETGAILPFFDRGAVIEVLRAAASESAEEGAPSADPFEAASLAALESLPASWSFRAEGPLWFRGYAYWEDEELAAHLDGLLAAHGARRVVAGHTPSESARIVRRLDDRVILIDTGMIWSLSGGGRASALEIAGGELREIYLEPPPPLEPAGAMLPRRELLALAEPSADAAPSAAEPVPPRILLGPDGGPVPFASDDEILAFLETAEVVEWKYVGEGITRPRRLVFEKNGYRLRAIFHDVDVVKDRVHLAGRGILLNYKDSYKSQVAGYRVARLLGLDNVPPALVFDWGRERGSAALWIEQAQTEGDRLAAGQEPRFPRDYHHRFFDMRVFDNLINNTDRNLGNIMFDAAGKFWYVDHTRAFGVSKFLPDPEKVKRCSRPLWNALRSLDEAKLEAAVSDLLTRPEQKALLKRRDHLVELLQGEIDRLSEQVVIFEYDTPDPGGEAAR